ncbi:MAG: hypothetical protein KQH53_12590 [Desulfarculaceae bacterium]|nr:hypothetical protein [Desulfarculaceae bacterium]
MLEQLRLLVRLQATDKTMFDLSQERDAIPARLAELTRGEETLGAELAREQAQLDELLGRRAALEEIADNIRTRLRRAENRLMGSKTPKEYQAANAEIDDNKDALKDNDNQLLELMEFVEALEQKVAGLSERLSALSAASKDERAQLEERYLSLEAEVRRLEAKRGKLTGDVDSKLMKDYDFIRQARDGIAIAAVSEGSCNACHMGIPPQQFNELQRMDKIMTCPSCRRLIYWADAPGFETDEAKAKKAEAAEAEAE